MRHGRRWIVKIPPQYLLRVFLWFRYITHLLCPSRSVRIDIRLCQYNALLELASVNNTYAANWTGPPPAHIHYPNQAVALDVLNAAIAIGLPATASKALMFKSVVCFDQSNKYFPLMLYHPVENLSSLSLVGYLEVSVRCSC